ncbi:MAG TPA: hypothetical protein VHP11_04080 [Tepidisphaeraceae bacterium]|nr:hypothetical protein [Tepidisphaeraceae bacterium]
MKVQGEATRARQLARSITPIDYATLLSGFSEKERQSFERQVLAYETALGAGSADAWRRLTCVLKTLTPSPAKLSSSHTVQFYIPDGKYRKQVFAIHGTEDGTLTIYARDILADAIREGILGKPHRGDTDNTYRLGKSGETLMIEPLDGKTPNPDLFYKDMTGWNRKAIRITLPAKATESQIGAVEQICLLAATEWTAASPE